MSHKLTIADASPQQLAWLRLKHLSKKEGKSISDYEETHPEDVRMSREYMAEYMRNYRKVKRAARETFNFQEGMSWYELIQITSRYQDELRRGKPFEEVEDGAFKRECASYTSRIRKLDLAKRKLHPNLSPTRLGPDPRTRDWPSGRIIYGLEYIPKPTKKRSHSARRANA